MKHLILALLFALPLAGRAADPPPALKNTNCAPHPVETNRIECDLVADEALVGIGIAPGTYAAYVNRTTQWLQINEARAYTGERGMWAEFCVLTQLVIGQASAGMGEVGCAAKNVGEDYPPVTFGAGTGLSVPPGGVVYLNSSTQPFHTNHTYTLKVVVQTTGLHSWRQPAMDGIISCNGQSQASQWSPWRNDTGRTLHVEGAYVYAESAQQVGKNTVSGAACLYVIGANGAPKYINCDDALRTRGETKLPPGIIVLPGESLAAQAVNACAAPALWDWAAFIHVW